MNLTTRYSDDETVSLDTYQLRVDAPLLPELLPCCHYRAARACFKEIARAKIMAQHPRRRGSIETTKPRASEHDQPIC